MSGKDRITKAGSGDGGLARLLAAYGSALERWPDVERAAEARCRLMSNRPFRAAWEDERELDRALIGLRVELDGELAAKGAAERLRASVMARLPRPLDGVRWRSLAAAMVLAAFLGAAFQALRPPAYAEPGPALLDPTLPEIEEPLAR